MTKVAFGLVNWNSATLVLRVVSMIFGQIGVEPHIVIVDNGSRPHDLSVLEALEGPSTEIIRLRRNAGYAAAMNLAIRRLRTWNPNFIIILNSDVNFDDETVRRLIEAQGASGDGIVCPVIEESNHGLHYRYYGRIISPITGRGREITSKPGNAVSPLQYPNGAFLMIEPRVFDVAGYLPENYFAYWEEMAWARDARARGVRIGLAPSITVAHATTSITPVALKTFLVARNRFLFQRNLSPLRLAVFVIAELTMGFLQEWVALARSEAAKDVRRALRLGEWYGLVSIVDPTPPLAAIERLGAGSKSQNID